MGAGAGTGAGTVAGTGAGTGAGTALGTAGAGVEEVVDWTLVCCCCAAMALYCCDCCTVVAGFVGSFKPEVGVELGWVGGEIRATVSEEGMVWELGATVGASWVWLDVTGEVTSPGGGDICCTV